MSCKHALSILKWVFNLKNALNIQVKHLKFHSNHSRDEISGWVALVSPGFHQVLGAPGFTIYIPRFYPIRIHILYPKKQVYSPPKTNLEPENDAEPKFGISTFWRKKKSLLPKATLKPPSWQGISSKIPRRDTLPSMISSLGCWHLRTLSDLPGMKPSEKPSADRSRVIGLPNHFPYYESKGWFTL